MSGISIPKHISKNMWSDPKRLPKGFVKLTVKKPPKLPFPLLPLRPCCKNDNWCTPLDQKRRVPEKLRKAMLVRDRCSCRFCGHFVFGGKQMATHHRNSNEDTLDAVVTGCVACHAIQHIGRNLMLRKIEIWKSPFSQLEIVWMTRRAIKEGKTLASVKKRLKLKENFLETACIDFANVMRKRASKHMFSYLDALDKDLKVIFVDFKRWQIE